MEVSNSWDPAPSEVTRALNTVSPWATGRAVLKAPEVRGLCAFPSWLQGHQSLTKVNQTLGESLTFCLILDSAL